MLRRMLLMFAMLAALSGCGSDNPRFIPAEQADTLKARIDEADRLVQDGQCEEAREALRDARLEVDRLPGTVARSLRSNLRQWVRALEDRLPDACEPERTPEPSPSPTATATEAPVVTPEPTAAPTEPPVEPTPTPTPPPEVTVEPGSGGAVPPEDEE